MSHEITTVFRPVCSACGRELTTAGTMTPPHHKGMDASYLNHREQYVITYACEACFQFRRDARPIQVEVEPAPAAASISIRHDTLKRWEHAVDNARFHRPSHQLDGVWDEMFMFLRAQKAQAVPVPIKCSECNDTGMVQEFEGGECTLNMPCFAPCHDAAPQPAPPVCPTCAGTRVDPGGLPICRTCCPDVSRRSRVIGIITGVWDRETQIDDAADEVIDFLDSLTRPAPAQDAPCKNCGEAVSNGGCAGHFTDDESCELRAQAGSEKAQPAAADKNTGCGWVYPRADGVKMKCGGPSLCRECSHDLAMVKRLEGESE